MPEFGSYAHTHGETYEEALKNAREVLDLLVESYRADNQPLPEPQTFSNNNPIFRTSQPLPQK